MKKRILSWLSGHRAEDGQAMVIAAVAMVVIIGFGAFAVDLGNVAIQKSDLQNAADAAALAGVVDMPSTNNAVSTALTYAKTNGMKVTANNVTVDGQKVYAYPVGTGQLRVECTKEVQYYFAGVFGAKSKQVTAVAVAQKSGTVNGVSGLRPWALKNTYTYTYGLEFVLKLGGGDGSNGYYGIVAYGDQNANASNVYKDNITNGYGGVVKVGDVVETGQGNDNVKNVINALMTKSGDTSGDYTKATPGDSRVVLIPKIDASTLKVTGFSVIYLKSVDNKGNITANFLFDTSWTQSDQDAHEDWGLQDKAKLVL